jgi:uncharacterized protein with PQ loop repeat
MINEGEKSTRKNLIGIKSQKTSEVAWSPFCSKMIEVFGWLVYALSLH